MNNNEFADRYAGLTGGARGISYEAAKVLVDRGLSGIVLADLDIGLAEQSAKELMDLTGCKAFAFKTDVSNAENIEALFAFAAEKMPTIDILINGAGVCPTTPIEEEDAAKWDFA